MTFRLIEADGFKVDYKVRMSAASTTEEAVCASIARGLKGFSGLLSSSAYDAMLVLGDRFELISACTAALVHKVPIIHIHGGESTTGAIDDSIRHAVTKMSSLHFPSHPVYRERIIRMGEPPERVHYAGALGLDNIKAIKPMTRRELSAFSGVDFDRDVALVTYHPVTRDGRKEASRQARMVFEALRSKAGLACLVTAPNPDAGGLEVLKVAEGYCKRFPARFKLVKSLGQRAYLSAMKHASLMVGNSSSGIIEAASFRLPVVNVGDRQGGRIKPKNVIDTAADAAGIGKAITKALSKRFRGSLEGLKNPYGDGRAAQRIMKVLHKTDLHDREALLKKPFHDLPLKS